MNTQRKTCKECDGIGYYEKMTYLSQEGWDITQVIPCNNCDGMGYIETDMKYVCLHCNYISDTLPGTIGCPVCGHSLVLRYVDDIEDDTEDTYGS